MVPKGDLYPLMNTVFSSSGGKILLIRASISGTSFSSK